MYYEFDNYLAHHGIMGQKWGVRRFQNKDGSRTPLGKKRERENNKIDHDKLIKSTNAKELYKHRDQLSDRELQDRLNRLRNEDALGQMAGAKKSAKNGQSVAGKVLAKVGEKSAEIIAVAAVGAILGTTNGKELGAKIAVGARAVKEHGPDFVNFFMDDWKP